MDFFIFIHTLLRALHGSYNIGKWHFIHLSDYIRMRINDLAIKLFNLADFCRMPL